MLALRSFRSWILLESHNQEIFQQLFTNMSNLKSLTFLDFTVFYISILFKP